MLIEQFYNQLQTDFGEFGVQISLGLKNDSYQMTINIGGILYLGVGESVSEASADALCDLRKSAFYREWRKDNCESNRSLPRLRKCAV